MARAGLSARVALGQGDATAFDPAALFGRARFDRVMISYALSMIPPWREALERALDVLAPGGSLHLVDFGAWRRAARPVQDRIAPLARRLRCDPARRSRRRARGALGRARPDVRDRDPVPRLRRSGGRTRPLLRAAGRCRRAGWGVAHRRDASLVARTTARACACPDLLSAPHPALRATFPSKLGKGSVGLSRRTPARG